MNTAPEPSADATPVAEPETVELEGGQRASVTFKPELSGTEFVVPVVAVSKGPETVYEVLMDDMTVWGPAAIPPTDIDDLEAVWIPARTFTSSMTVKVTNFREIGTREYHILPIGWEEP